MSAVEDDSVRAMTFLDVGQGDCTLVIDRESRVGLLVDCRASAVRGVIRRLRDQHVQTIDVIITHWDADHYTGAVRVARNYRTRRIYYNLDTVRDPDPDKEDRRTLALRTVEAIPAGETELCPALEGAEGTVGTIRWSLLAPTYRELLECHNSNDRNHASAIVFVEGASAEALVGGDADGRVWARLANEGNLPTAAVLRCSHHGGNIANGPSAINESQLYQAVNPHVLVVSTGTRNTYGHPFEPTVTEARALGVRVMCTQATARCAASMNVHPCAGDIHLYLDSGRVYPDEEFHRTVMSGLAPMCNVPVYGCDGVVDRPLVDDPGERDE